MTVPGFGNVLVRSNKDLDGATNRAYAQQSSAARNRRMHSLGFRKPGENSNNDLNLVKD